MQKRSVHIMQCHVAGRKVHEAGRVWDELRVVTVLRIVRYKDNRYDPKAVALVYDKLTEVGREEYVIGYIPKGENEVIAGFMDMGWDEMFECRICRINPIVHSEQQLYVNVRIQRRYDNRE